MVTKMLQILSELLKKNWFAIVGVLIALFLGVWQNYEYKKQLESVRQESAFLLSNHETLINELRQTHIDEMEAQQRINEQLLKELTRVEVEYKAGLASLESQNRNRRQTTVTETEGNPDEMARRLRERLGWQ